MAARRTTAAVTPSAPTLFVKIGNVSSAFVLFHANYSSTCTIVETVPAPYYGPKNEDKVAWQAHVTEVRARSNAEQALVMKAINEAAIAGVPIVAILSDRAFLSDAERGVFPEVADATEVRGTLLALHKYGKAVVEVVPSRRLPSA